MKNEVGTLQVEQWEKWPEPWMKNEAGNNPPAGAVGEVASALDEE
jgi:hypothetical protein